MKRMWSLIIHITHETHLTETAISILATDIIQSFNQDGYRVLAYMDLSAAFDTVDLNIFVARLQTTFGIKTKQ